MRVTGLNLAERPFANERPARRTTLLVWLLALALLAVNVFLYYRHLSGQQEQRQALLALEERIAEEKASLQALEQQLIELDLKRQNRQVVFLNGQIARRTFSWSHLLDRLTEVLPESVQLRRVSPRFVGDRRGRRPGTRAELEEVVALDMGGVARSGEAVLTLLDAFFEHQSFTSPNLANEHKLEDGRQEFVLSVLYLPARSRGGGAGDQAATTEGVAEAEGPDDLDASGGSDQSSQPIEDSVAIEAAEGNR